MQTSELADSAALAPGTRLGIIGAGAMGGALLRGVLGSGVPFSAVWAATKSESSARIVANEFGVAAHTSYAELTASSDVILLAVKPAQVPGAVKELVLAGLRADALVISVAAGVSIARIEAELPGQNPVIRAMPNTPSFVGKGMTAIAAGTHATKAHLAAAERLFAAVGLC
ncbi:MAG TPA: NAD(P)-binding domain-containing protein, partial [Casimicrobiaceae bacterium]